MAGQHGPSDNTITSCPLCGNPLTKNTEHLYELWWFGPEPFAHGSATNTGGAGEGTGSVESLFRNEFMDAPALRSSRQSLDGSDLFFSGGENPSNISLSNHDGTPFLAYVSNQACLGANYDGDRRDVIPLLDSSTASQHGAHLYQRHETELETYAARDSAFELSTPGDEIHR